MNFGWPTSHEEAMALMDYELKQGVYFEVIPACREYGLRLVPWSRLRGGILGGALRQAKEGRRASKGARRLIESHIPQLEAYEKLCRDLGEAPGEVAIAWLLV